MGSFDKVINVARKAFNSGKTQSLSFRLAQLKQMLKMMDENKERIVEALNRDMRKTRLEATIYEITIIRQEIVYFLKNLKKFAEPESLPVNLLAILDSGIIRKQPYGVVLIIGPWNYPFALSLQTMTGAIAAGNVVILKPSEIASHSAKLMSELIPQYLDKECYQCVEANAQETGELLKQKFDYIFFTGSTTVGKVVAKAAAEHLTPVTLELGGKSPCYIDSTADFACAAKRVLWGKCMNMGQTCIAPDYLLCNKAAEDTFIKVAKEVMTEWYGSNIQNSKDLPRIINERNCLRLKKLLETTKGKIAFGGKIDVDDLWIEPTIVTDVTPDDSLMQEELFGPILPIVTVNSVDEAIALINSKPRPLALYSFSKSSKVNEKIVNETISGGVCINDVIWHCGWHGLPFGGVGDSGMGNYHGKASFDTFSHTRSILQRSFSAMSEKLGEARYPPNTEGKISFFMFVVSYFEAFNVGNCKILTHLLAACVGAAMFALYVTYIGN